jgi:ISXO2-like transposase domain
MLNRGQVKLEWNLHVPASSHMSNGNTEQQPPARLYQFCVNNVPGRVAHRPFWLGHVGFLDSYPTSHDFIRNESQFRVGASAVNRQALQTAVLDQVAPGSSIFTDEASVYKSLPKEYTHEFVNHVEKYVNGRVHTNGMENFWSLLKRGLNGTYVAVEPFHLHRYLDEQMFRYNNRKDESGRKLTDAERFGLALSQIVGKRLTFAEVTGKVNETPF